MPVDGGMVPSAQPLFPYRLGAEGVVDGGCRIGAEHAKEVEYHACRGPAVVGLGAPYQKDGAYHHAEHDAAGVAP